VGGGGGGGVGGGGGGDLFNQLGKCITGGSNVKKTTNATGKLIIRKSGRSRTKRQNTKRSLLAEVAVKGEKRRGGNETFSPVKKKR